MGKYKRLGLNTILIFIGNIGSKFISLIMLPFYTRWLSVDDYGITDLITTYVTLILGVVSCCIYESLFVFPKDQEKKKQISYFSSGLLFLFGSAILTFIIFAVVEYFFCSADNSFMNNIWLIYFMLESQLLMQSVQAFVRSIDKIKVYSITGIVCTIASSALGFLIIPKYGVYGYVVSISIASCIASTYCFISARAYRYIKLNEISTGRLFEMLKYSMALVPTSVTWWMISTLNRPLLEKYVGYHDIGIYAVANKFPGLLTTVFVIFGTSWQISVMEEFGSTGYHKFYNNAVRGIFIVMAIVLIFMTAFCLPMLRLFTIPDYYDARFIMPFLAFSTLLSNLGSMAGTNFLATKQSRYLLYTSIWGALAAFFFNFLLIPQFGLMGAVASTLISMLILTISRIAYSYKYVKLDNLTSYISISFLVLGYFAIFYCVDNVTISIFSGIFFAGCIIYLERALIVNLVQKNEKLKKFLYSFKK